ncbi:cytidylyltransferase domain-containing protein [Bacillus infantis]|uniref:cytidylyltransferase domain-containing protein n=1 Tax=Bacillus infantis TaxID=324767 RepID=UPI003CE9D6C2
MRVAAIIQARMGSTRLPGKILKTVNGKSLLEYQLERVRLSNTIDKIIVATTVKENEQPIIELCKNLTIDYFRGSEHDVLSRYYEAAMNHNIDVIVRLTSDCPLIDPAVIDKVVNHYMNNKDNIDYVSNTLERTFPRGLDTEVFSFKSLERAYHEANLSRDREHVTAYFYSNPKVFKLDNVTNNRNYGSFRWTVDTKEDFELIKLIISELYDSNNKFTLEDVIELLKLNPSWKELNAHIDQKKI